MNVIESVEIFSGHSKITLEINYNESKYLRMPYYEDKLVDVNRLCLNSSSRNPTNHNIYQVYNSFDKSEILKVQNILLNAYVFSHDKLDKALEDELSIEKLNNFKNLVIAIRTHLRYVSKYLIEYEEQKKEVIKNL